VQEEWTGYTEFLEQGCDAALFVGMHAKAGNQLGNMNHTVSGRDYQRLWFNGTEVGETGINAALCGTWNCPGLARHRRPGVLRRREGASSETG
jgi:D-amino peptidase